MARVGEGISVMKYGFVLIGEVSKRYKHFEKRIQRKKMRTLNDFKKTFFNYIER